LQFKSIDEQHNIINSDEEIKELVGQDNITFDEYKSIDIENYQMITIEGKYKTIRYTQNNTETIEITEIPINTSINNYAKFLDILRNKKIIKEYSNKSKGDIPKFIVKGMSRPSLRKLKLIQTISLSNMNLLDMDNNIKRFTNANDLMESWFEWRLKCYGDRKNIMLNSLIENTKDINDKIKFINAVIKYDETKQLIKGQTIPVLKFKKKIIFEYIDALNVPRNLLSKIVLDHCTLDEIEKLNEKVSKFKEEYDNLFKTKPEQLWIQDIELFTEEYNKHYNDIRYKY